MASNGKDLEDGLSWTCVVNCQRCSAWHPDGYLLVSSPEGDFDVYRVIVEPHAEDLKHAGIHHVDFWPEDILSDGIGLIGRGFHEPTFRTEAHEPQGPFHILVRDEDLARAQLVLSSRGLDEA